MTGVPPTEGARPDLSDPKALLRAKLGHNLDTDEIVDRFLEAENAFERGDNRVASEAIRNLLKRDLSRELRREAQALLRRIRPDRQALVVAVLCVLGLIAVWILAMR